MTEELTRTSIGDEPVGSFVHLTDKGILRINLDAIFRAGFLLRASLLAKERGLSRQYIHELVRDERLAPTVEVIADGIPVLRLYASEDSEEAIANIESTGLFQ